MANNLLKTTPIIEAYAAKCTKTTCIDTALYQKYDVKRGLRDINGEGVLAGLTNISEVIGKKKVDGQSVPCEGELFYRGINVGELVLGLNSGRRYGFEETAFLLLFGSLPNQNELEDFTELLASYRTLPTNFVRDVVMKAPSADMMNTLARSVLTLYGYDSFADDISIENVMRQCLRLMAVFPLLSLYGYHAHSHYNKQKSLYIHPPKPELSTAENILRLLRPDKQYTSLEAAVLDAALILHAEHGGGNNSTFTMHAVTSSGTDTYSAVAAALGSLKGPKHGGANIKVVQMFEDLKKNLKDWSDLDELSNYLERLLGKDAFDRQGLIYGMGHAVYSLSDPRATIFKGFVEKLSKEKNMEKEFALWQAVEELSPKIIAKKRRVYKGVSANVDFYSGFAYDMLGLPPELYTPLFAISRISGWSAHRLEELLNSGKIIRPAYKPVAPRQKYMPIEKR